MREPCTFFQYDTCRAGWGVGGRGVRPARRRPVHRAAHSGSCANEELLSAGRRRTWTCLLSLRRDTPRRETAVSLVEPATPALPLESRLGKTPSGLAGTPSRLRSTKRSEER